MTCTPEGSERKDAIIERGTSDLYLETGWETR